MVKKNTMPRIFRIKLWKDKNCSTAAKIEMLRRLKRLKAETGKVSYGTEILLQRIVFISMMLETAERTATDEEKDSPFDAGVYTQMVNAISGLISKVGLEKIKTKTTSDLRTFLSTKKRA